MTDQPPIDREAFKQFERTGYSRVAEVYGKTTAQVTSQLNDAVLNAVEAKSGTRLLDVACGPAWLSAAAAKRGAIVTGLDFAKNMLTIARARCPHAEFHEGDAENLPFEAGRLAINPVRKHVARGLVADASAAFSWVGSVVDDPSPPAREGSGELAWDSRRYYAGGPSPCRLLHGY
jgi:SAM-dependent methyltransferase